MNRRKFIQNTSALSIPLLLNGFMVKAFGENTFSSLLSNSDTDRVLVLIQLFGGNDGLNTVIPIDNYDKYFTARKNVAIAENKIIHLDGITNSGLHPSLSSFRDIYNDGKLSIIQSVGYPQPTLSHFRSSDIWLSASDADKVIYTGLMGRYLEQQYATYPTGYPNAITPHPLAIQIGTASSFLLQGSKVPMGVNVVDPNNVFSTSSGFQDVANQTQAGKALSFVRQIAQQSQSYGDVLKKTAANVKQQKEYPQANPVAAQLKTVAQLIKGGLQTKVYLVTYDGFDTHAQQVEANDSSTGRHADLLKTVADAIKAFQDDLKFLGIEDRVAGLTFSEFGRRIVPNDSYGTDHGTAAPVFVFGKKVKGGVIGKNPIIPDKATTDDNLEMEVDFRSVYTSLLKDWLNVPANEVEKILSRKFETLPIF